MNLLLFSWDILVSLKNAEFSFFETRSFFTNSAITFNVFIQFEFYSNSDVRRKFVYNLSGDWLRLEFIDTVKKHTKNE